MSSPAATGPTTQDRDSENLLRYRQTGTVALLLLIQVSHRGDLKAVHYNNRSIAPLQLCPADMLRFYSAYRHFAALLGNQRFQLKIKLNEAQVPPLTNYRSM